MTTALAIVVCLSLGARTTADDPTPPSGTVGMQVEIDDLVLPGTELEPKPVDDTTPVIIRIDVVSPHGSDLRYDMVCSGLEPGEFNLADYLQRKDGSPTDDLPALPFRVTSLLPPGQIEPHALEASRLPWLGGYRALMLTGALLWGVALAWLVIPRVRKPATTTAPDAAPSSLADRLRPLVAAAMAGQLPPPKLAELERALVQFWRRRLNIEDLPPSKSIAALRAHPEASPLIEQLEAWLHRPGGEQDVDINALLEPYRDVSPDELMTPADAAHNSGSVVAVLEAH